MTTLPLNSYEKDLNILILQGKSFKTIEKPSHKIIMLSEKQQVEYKSTHLPEGAYLCGMVAKNIDKINNLPEIKLIERPLVNQNNSEHILNYYTQNFVKKADNNVVNTTMIDINHCYWRTAYLLNYINKSTYSNGLDENRYIKKYLSKSEPLKELFEYTERYNIDDYRGFLLEYAPNNQEIQKILDKAKATSKQARLTAIGFLKNNKIENTYYKGKLIHTKDIGNQKYKLVRDNIINHVSNLYTNLVYDLNQYENQHLFKVDAFFCDSNKSEVVQSYLHENQYDFKVEHGFTYGKNGLINVMTLNKKYENQKPVNILTI